MEMAASLDCVAIITNHTLMDAALLAQIHAAGRRALVYTVNDARRAADRLGIDGIVTDAVDLAALAADQGSRLAHLRIDAAHARSRAASLASGAARPQREAARSATRGS